MADKKVSHPNALYCNTFPCIISRFFPFSLDLTAYMHKTPDSTLGYIATLEVLVVCKGNAVATGDPSSLRMPAVNLRLPRVSAV